MLKLNRFISKKKKPGHGSIAKEAKPKTSTLRMAGNRRKNMSILHHNLSQAEKHKPNRRLELNVPYGNDLEQTPGKHLLYENSE